MAKTSAERQAAYRANRASSGKNGDGQDRINTWVDHSIKTALERLAHSYGITEKDMLEKLIYEADEKMFKSFPHDDDAAFIKYINKSRI